ncbi:MAG: GlsB/YeaQ/YmgE family stress response membrane protein [Chamaesiphon sp.]|nr:GlsB/YeaQ/YmgE family stress response membrane protein [Chamaesiphon sp.]
MFGILGWAVLGLVAGAIAKAIYPGAQGGGLIATMVLGIVGAFIGGTLYTLISTGKFAIAALSGAALIPSLVFAVLGAMVAIFLWGLVTRNA